MLILGGFATAIAIWFSCTYLWAVAFPTWASLPAAAATCGTGGQMFVQSVVEAMYNYGVWVY